MSKTAKKRALGFVFAAVLLWSGFTHGGESASIAIGLGLALAATSAGLVEWLIDA